MKLSAILWICVMIVSSSAAFGVELLPVGLQKQLLVDDYTIAEKHNVSRQLGKHQKMGVVLKPSLDTNYRDCNPDNYATSGLFAFFTTVFWNENTNDTYCN